MAKNKKSKILAMALCASVMAGIYASPVMAKEFPLDSNSSVTTGTTTSGGYKQNEVHVNIDDGVNGSQTIGTFYSNEMEAGFKTDYTMTASTFTLEAGGRTWASLTVNGLTYTNQNTLNNVSLTADGLTFSNLGNSEATAVLNAAAINSWNEKTQNINAKETVAGKTYFDGKVIADKFGTSNDAFYVDENGTIKGNSLIIGKNGDNAVFKVDRNGNTEIKGNVTMAKDATVDGVDVSELGGNVAGISRNNGDLPYGQGVTSIEGVVSVDGQSGLVNFSTGNGNGVLINSSQGQIIANSVGANQIVGENLSGGNGAFRVSENGDILMQNGSGESISMTDGGLNLMSTDNGTGMVTLRDGSVSLMGNGTSTVTVDENGTTFGTVLGSETTNINGGTVTASGDFVTVDENGNEKYTLNTIGDNTQAIKYQDGVTTIGGETLAVTDEGYVTINNGAFAIGPDGMATVGNNIQLDGETGVVSANDLRANNNVYSKNYNLEEVGADLKELSGDFTTTNANVAGIERIGEGAPGEGITTIEGDALFVSKNVTYMSSGDAMIQTSTDSAYMSFGDNMISINKGGINLTGSVGFTGHDGGRYTLSDLEGRVYDLEQKTQNITSADPGQGGSSEVPPTGDGHTGFEGDVTVGDNVTVGGDANIDGNANVSGNVNVDGQINVGSTVVDKNGITAENGTFTNVNVGGENGTSINHDEVRVGGADGSYMNDNDVVTGEGNSLNDTANRVGNLEQGVSELNNRVGELEDRIDKVGAMAAAIANLRTMGYDPAAPTEVAVGIGQYRDETGAALGLFHYPNRDFMLSLSVSTSGDEVMGGIGATWKFGRKSPEKVAEIKKAQAEADARRAEEAKLAKAEEMKQAAKEAKIKAQQERHAKLAAERAAQAEAAK